MKGHHDQPPARLERAFRRFETAQQLAEFVVDGDAQRLKRAGRGMRRLARPGGRDAGDHVGQLARRDVGRAHAVGDDGAGDAPRRALLAEIIEDVGDRLFVVFAQDVGGAAPNAFHAHVERRVLAEREAAGGLVELHRGYADVENDAVERLGAEAARDRVEIAEASLDQPQAARRRRDEILARGDGGRIAIEGDDARAALDERAGITAGPESAVEIDAAGANPQRVQRLGAQHGNVAGGSAGGGDLRAARPPHSRAPGGAACAALAPNSARRRRTRDLASSRCAANRIGSHI